MISAGLHHSGLLWGALGAWPSAEYCRRRGWPARRHWRRLAFVTGGAAGGWPPLVSLALRDAPSVHGIVITGLQPGATAMFAVVRGGERPRMSFRLAAGAGLLAALCSGLGFAEGGVLARELGSGSSAWRWCPACR